MIQYDETRLAMEALTPQIEELKEQGTEILYFTEEVDEFCAQILHTFQDKEFRSVLDQEIEEGAEKKAEEAADAHKAVFDFVKETLGDQVKEEELVEGMQEEDGHTHEEEHTHDDDLEYDEHVWLSLKNASLFCDTIASSLADVDPEHSRLYQQNAEAYEEKLAALDQEYQTSVEKSQSKTLLFADRFPFRYLIDDYNLTYYAAFAGCSAETDASFETITFLAGKLDELNLPAVLTIENSDQKVAKAVIENTNTKDQKILTLNSMQSVTTKDVEEGTTYLSIMENNLQILKEAL